MKTNINWDTRKKETDLICAIAQRAVRLSAEHNIERDEIDVAMDITATHKNGCPLRLNDLLSADDFNFAHDIAGIERHLDRTTGKLSTQFSPRFSQK